MRGHPELLGSITRKKSAKEIAAAQAAHGGAHSADKHDHAMSDGEKATAGGKHREDDADHDMDGEPVVRPDGLGVGGTTSAGPPKPTKTAVSESAADSSVSRALTLMHATHSSLEKELAALKSSNEMLWRQWMLSREEQIKSEKKVDNIMRFLAGQFGGMNMNMAIDDGPADGARNDGAPSGIGNATVPSSPRLRRLGSSKLIEHGIHGLGDSPSDVMSFDGDALSPSKDADDGEIWEFDDSGQLVKLKTSELGGFSPDFSFVPDGSPPLNPTQAKSRRRRDLSTGHPHPPELGLLPIFPPRRTRLQQRNPLHRLLPTVSSTSMDRQRKSPWARLTLAITRGKDRPSSTQPCRMVWNSNNINSRFLPAPCFLRHPSSRLSTRPH
jgi:hypothetical protein